MLRIGIDARPLTSESTGLRTYAINIVQALLKRSEIELLLYTHDSPSLQALIGDKSEIKDLWNIKGFSRHLVLPYYAVRDKLDFMLFLCNSSWWLFGCKTAIVVHDLIPDLYPEIFLDTAGSKINRFLQRLAYKRANMLVTGSNNAKEQLTKNLNISKNKIHVIYHGLNPALSPQSQPDDNLILAKYALSQQDYLLYVGSLDIRKNLSSLVTAFADLVTNYGVSHRLALTGTPLKVGTRRYPNILAQAKDLGIEDKVNFLGAVADEELPALFRHAAVFVFPSLYEGFGLPPLEAMACGTPVVCSNLPPMTEVLADGALYVDSTQPNELARRILDILENMSLQEEFAERGLKRSMQFSWDVAAEQLVFCLKDYNNTLLNNS